MEEKVEVKKKEKKKAKDVDQSLADKVRKMKRGRISEVSKDNPLWVPEGDIGLWTEHRDNVCRHL